MDKKEIQERHKKRITNALCALGHIRKKHIAAITNYDSTAIEINCTEEEGIKYCKELRASGIMGKEKFIITNFNMYPS